MTITGTDSGRMLGIECRDLSFIMSEPDKERLARKTKTTWENPRLFSSIRFFFGSNGEAIFGFGGGNICRDVKKLYGFMIRNKFIGLIVADDKYYYVRKVNKTWHCK